VEPEARSQPGRVWRITRVTLLVIYWILIVAFTIVTVRYFLPAQVAIRRHVPDTGSIMALNILAGWTLIGWVVAMVWACRDVPLTAAEAQTMIPQAGN
jgi:hypothetical protein